MNEKGGEVYCTSREWKSDISRSSVFISFGFRNYPLMIKIPVDYYFVVIYISFIEMRFSILHNNDLINCAFDYQKGRRDSRASEIILLTSRRIEYFTCMAQIFNLPILPFPISRSLIFQQCLFIVWKLQFTPSRPDFLCHPVVIESIFYRTTVNRLINKRNTTEWLRKIWTGCSIDLIYFVHLKKECSIWLESIAGSIIFSLSCFI